MGSTSTTVDADGDRVSEMRYSPWGSVRFSDGVSPTDFTYTGQLSKVDGFGLMYYKARWYDVSLGRFSQADNVIPSHEYVLDWDRYQYVRSNPLRYSDPSGNCSVVALENRSCGVEDLFFMQPGIHDHIILLINKYPPTQTPTVTPTPPVSTPTPTGTPTITPMPILPPSSNSFFC
jgi:RHS repeat-associated protein